MTDGERVWAQLRERLVDVVRAPTSRELVSRAAPDIRGMMTDGERVWAQLRYGSSRPANMVIRLVPGLK